MKVCIKDFQVTMALGNNGIELDVSDGNGHIGDLRIGKATIEWCGGKTQQGNGIKKSWPELIRLFDPNYKR